MTVCIHIRMLDGILVSLPEEVAKNLKSQDFWPIFSRHSRVWIVPIVYIISIEIYISYREFHGKEVTEYQSKLTCCMSLDTDCIFSTMGILVEQCSVYTANDNVLLCGTRL